MYIVATISKNSYPAEKIEGILREGARVLRFNFSHGTPNEMAERIGIAREVIKKLNLEGEVKILADLPGNKIRLGKFPGVDHPVKKGDEIIFKSSDSSSDPVKYIPINLDNISKYVNEGQEISFGDGEIGFKVLKIVDINTFTAVALNDRYISSEKGVNFGQTIDLFDHVTEKTIEHIKNLINIKPDWVAFSFVNSAGSMKRLKNMLNEYFPNNNVKVISKIETPLAIKNLNEIINESDIVMVARGDLGLTVPFEKLGVLQKRIIKESKRQGREVIVATQIIDSLMSYYIPSRAEISDITNIVFDKASGIMMAKETGMSLTPEYSVKVVKKIIEEAEKEMSL